MDFSFTEEQELLRATVREFCEKEITSEKIRAWEETLDFMPDEVWRKAADIGLFSASLPDEYGGEGADMVTAMVAFEEISKASTAVALGPVPPSASGHGRSSNSGPRSRSRSSSPG